MKEKEREKLISHACAYASLLTYISSDDGVIYAYACLAGRITRHTFFNPRFLYFQLKSFFELDPKT